jgi:DNA-binding CsgD family transcriptional regulator
MGGDEAQTGPPLLCPDLVGRVAELAALRSRVEASGRRGGVVVLLGDAGAGKTRLVRETVALARARDVPVLAGRCVPGAHPVPYRPLTEAFLHAFRSTPPPDADDLGGLAGHLGRLVPAWRGVGALEESPVLLGEAVVRLLRRLGDGRGCLLVLEDLHWADPETLAVLDHLGDAARDEPVLCVCTARPSGAAGDTLDRLTRRDPGSAIPIGPLAPPDVDRMIAACLATPSPPPEVAAFVHAHADGSPFLVEELLAGLVSSGALRFADGRWTRHADLTPTVPASLRESVRRRLCDLDPVARRVVGAAALLGRRFDWELLPGIAEVDGRAVVDALRGAVDGQLVEPDGDGFVFRHALTREAVLADLLPPDRRHLARRAWPAVERAHPGLPGALCELAAELAEAAGRPDVAAERLVESARRALADGALISAETAARRARRLAAAADAALAVDADELLVHVLVAAGKPGDARALGLRLVAHPGLEPGRRADLLVVTARAALTAGDTAAAEGDAAAARAALGADADPAAQARVDAVAAYTALDAARFDEAAALAHAAVAVADATGQPAVACEALEVLGRVAAVQEPARAEAWYRRAAEVASDAGLPTWHLRARHELALEAWSRGDLAPMVETRHLAARYGAMRTVAVMELSLADIALAAFDRAGCLAAATACVEASRRFGLATEPLAHLWLAGAHALAGDDAAMHAEIARARSRDPDDPRILGDVHGRVLATRLFVAGDLDALRGRLDTMIGYVRTAPPGVSVFPGRVWWATLHAVDDDDLGVAARDEFAAATEAVAVPAIAIGLDIVDAVVLGRRGARAEAAALVAGAREKRQGLALSRAAMHTQLLLAARAALRDGWGEPVVWLREAEAFFAAGGYDHTARRCRALLAEAGAPVPRRGRGDSAVPVALRGLGVTSREVDVLKLVASGLSNREIADRLVLSPKTVERHLASLFDRTGVRSRAALGTLARTHGVQDG